MPAGSRAQKTVSGGYGALLFARYRLKQCFPGLSSADFANTAVARATAAAAHLTPAPDCVPYLAARRRFSACSRALTSASNKNFRW